MLALVVACFAAMLPFYLAGTPASERERWRMVEDEWQQTERYSVEWRMQQELRLEEQRKRDEVVPRQAEERQLDRVNLWHRAPTP